MAEQVVQGIVFEYDGNSLRGLTEDRKRAIDLGKSLDQVQKEIKSLGKEAKSAKGPMDKLSKEFKDASKEMKVLQKNTKAGANELKALILIEKEGVDASDRRAQALIKEARATDQLAKETERAKSEAQGFTGIMRKLNGTFQAAKVFALAAAMAAVSFATAESLKVYAEFQQTMANVQAIIGGTAEQMAFLEGEARRMGATTAFTASQAADAFRKVVSSSPQLLESAENLTKVTDSVLLFAQASGTTLEEAARTVGTALNQFQLGASEADRVVNLFAAGIQRGAAVADEFTESLKEFGSLASVAGVGLEDVTAAIQLLATVEIKGTRAGTGLKNMFIQLERQANDNFKPSIVGVEQALRNLSAAQLGFTDQIKLFGRIAAPSAAFLVAQADRFAKLKTDITDTTTAYEQQRIQMDTLKMDYKQFTSAMEELKIIAGEALAPLARDLLQTATGFARNTAEAYKMMSSLREVREESHQLAIDLNKLGVEADDPHTIDGLVLDGPRGGVGEFFDRENLGDVTRLRDHRKRVKELVEASNLFDEASTMLLKQSLKFSTEFSGHLSALSDPIDRARADLLSLSKAFRDAATTDSSLEDLDLENIRLQYQNLADTFEVIREGIADGSVSGDSNASALAEEFKQIESIFKRLADVQILAKEFGSENLSFAENLRAFEGIESIMGKVAESLSTVKTRQEELVNVGYTAEAAEWIASVEEQIRVLDYLADIEGFSAEQKRLLLEISEQGIDVTKKGVDSLLKMLEQRESNVKKLKEQEEAERAATKAKADAEKAIENLNKSLDQQAKLLELERQGVERSSHEYRIYQGLIAQQIPLDNQQAQALIQKARLLDYEQRMAKLAAEGLKGLVKAQHDQVSLSLEVVDIAGDVNDQLDRLIEHYGQLTPEVRLYNEAQLEEYLQKQLLLGADKERIETLRDLWHAYREGQGALSDLKSEFGTFSAQFISDALSGVESAVGNLFESIQSQFAGVMGEIFSGKPEGGFQLGYGGGFDTFANWLGGDSYGARGTRGGVSGLLAGYGASQQYGFGSQESQIQGVLGGAASGFATAGWVGAAVGAIAGAITSGVFTGSDWSKIGERISLEIQGGALTGATAFQVEQRNRAFFGGTATRDYQIQLGTDRKLALEREVDNIIGSITDRASAMGIDVGEAWLSGLDAAIEVDLTGLDSEEDIQKAYEEAFAELERKLVYDAVPFFLQLFDTGENAAAQFDRLSQSVSLAMDLLDLVGTSFEDVVPANWGDQFFVELERQFRETMMEELFNADHATGAIDDSGVPIQPNPGQMGQLNQATQDYMDGLDVEQVLEAARIAYLDAVTEFLGGIEAAQEAYTAIAATFHDTTKLAESQIASSLGDAVTEMTDIFDRLGTSRETLFADFNAAIEAGELDPETMALWLDAQAQLAEVMRLERELAAIRGEALNVNSLTVDQLRVLREDTERFNELLGNLGVAIQFTEQDVLNLEAAFGSLDDFSGSLGSFLDAFLSEDEQAAIRMQNLNGVLAELGLTVDELSAGGREWMVNLLNGFLAAGDYESAQIVLDQLGPLADWYITTLESEADIKALLGEQTATLVESLKSMGIELNLTAEKAQQLAEALGVTVEGLGDAFTYVFSNFLSDQEQIAIAGENASTWLQQAGFDLDSLSEIGRRGFYDLVNAAAAAGDAIRLEELLNAAPFVDAFFDAIEAASRAGESATGADDSINAVGDAISDAGNSANDAQSDFAALAETISGLRNKIASARNQILGMGVPGAGPNVNLGARIDTLYGRIGSGSIDSQLSAIDELTGLIVQRYQNEYDRIVGAGRQNMANLNAASQAEVERQQRIHDEKVRTYEMELEHFENMQRLASGLRSFIEDITFGEQSTKLDHVRLEDLRSEALRQIAEVDAGTSDGSGITDIFREILSLGGSIYGSSGSYQSIYDWILSESQRLESVASAFDAPKDPGEIHLPQISQSSGITAAQTVRINQAQQEAIDELNALEEELARLQAEAEAEEERRYQETQSYRDQVKDNTFTTSENVLLVDDKLETSNVIGTDSLAVLRTIENNTFNAFSQLQEIFEERPVRALAAIEKNTFDTFSAIRELDLVAEASVTTINLESLAPTIGNEFHNAANLIREGIAGQTETAVYWWDKIFKELEKQNGSGSSGGSPAPNGGTLRIAGADGNGTTIRQNGIGSLPTGDTRTGVSTR